MSATPLSLATPNLTRAIRHSLLWSLVCVCLTGTSRAGNIARYDENPILLTSAAPGDTVVFADTEHYDNPEAAAGTFEWFHNDVMLPGETSPLLQLDLISSAHNGNYRLHSTLPGQAPQWSNTLVLNVRPLPTSPVDSTFTADLPLIAQQPGVIGVFDDGTLVVEALVDINELAEPIPTVTDTAIPHSQFNRYEYRPIYYLLDPSGRRDSRFNFPPSAGRVLTITPEGGLITSHGSHILNRDSSTTPLKLPASADPTAPLNAAALTTTGVLYVSQGHRIARFDTLHASGSLIYSDARSDHTFEYLTLDSSGGLIVELASPLTYTPAGGPPIPHQDFYLFRLTAAGIPDNAFAESKSLNQSHLSDLVTFDGGHLVLNDYRSNHARFIHANGTPRTDLNVPDLLTNSTDTWFFSRNVSDQLFGTVMSQQLDPRWSPLRHFVLSSEGLRENPTPYFGLPDFADNKSFGTHRSHLGTSPYTADDGSLFVGGDFIGWDGHASRGLIKLQPDLAQPRVPFAATGIGSNPPAGGVLLDSRTPLQPGYRHTINGTTSLTFHCRIEGLPDTTSHTIEWLALDDQPLPPDHFGTILTIEQPDYRHLGRYQARVSTSEGSFLSTVIEFQAGPSPTALANLSARVPSGVGDRTPIIGFSVAHQSQGIVRAVGPGLVPFGVNNVIPAAGFRLHYGDGSLLNEPTHFDQSEGILEFSREVGAFPLPADGTITEHNTVNFYHLLAGRYTAHLLDAPDTFGRIGLLEIYLDLDQAKADYLQNLSFRTYTGTGEAQAVAGLVLVDPSDLGRSRDLLVRAVGPGLSGALGTHDLLLDPVIEVRREDGSLVTEIDNWNDTDGTAELAAQVGAFPLESGSLDAAARISLPPGVHTLTVSGRNGETGIVLVEIYAAPYR